ncbi:hypothetical protein G6011_03511 [Alternaria panax]|uniref:Rhodopsin domain-containing protein n=1 Tax=Alternaria panax TaxID=48097 RepID=A0AAD4NR64_9PLEO|nr:hypothetical protein G6011_03511 [Alternaria panax]
MESALRIYSTNGYQELRVRQLMPGSERNDSQAPVLLGVCGSLTLFAVLLLSARLWSRVRPFWNLHLDDWTAVVATFLAIAKYIIVCLACAHGFSQRTKYVPAASRLAAMRLIFFCQALWNVSICLVKISVTLLLLRIKQTRAWRIFLYSTIFRPFSVYWDRKIFRIGGVECVPQEVITGNIVAASTVHVSTDLVFSFIPITFIRKLHRPRGEKIFLGVLMGLGLFASSFAILRTAGANMIYTSHDVFRTTVVPMLWSMLELELALIAATIPTLKSFVQKSPMRIGRFFYDEKTESQVRGRLAELGFLDANSDELVGLGRKLSKPDIGDEMTLGSVRMSQKRKNEYAITAEELTRWESGGHGNTQDLRAFGP